MLLAIDVGNTNLVFALFEGDDLRARWRISTDGRRTGDEYAVWLFQLLGIEGVGRDLYPDLNPLEEVRPYILEIYLKRLTSPGYHVRTPRRIVEAIRAKHP